MIRVIKKTTWIAILTSLGLSWMGCYGQPTGLVENEKFDKRLSYMLDSSEVPFLDVNSLKSNKQEYILLDARAREEFEISHIPGAIWIGENNYEKEDFDLIDRSKPVVVYCSVGYRSQLAGNKLQKFGFPKVYNLYGSIFEWANRSYPLENIEGESTKRLHTYNSNWSKWVDNEEIEKVY
jgi:rhodanese-related sulfurtransferase